MPFIGDAFFRAAVSRLRIRCTVELFRGLAQRNKGRKTSYFEGYFPKNRTAIRKEAVSPARPSWDVLRVSRAPAAAPSYAGWAGWSLRMWLELERRKTGGGKWAAKKR
jgi:hypothetical protein